MTFKSKRRTLSILATGFLGAVVPWRIVSASSSQLQDATTLVGLDNDNTPLPVTVTVSTLGIGSAVITLSNLSKKRVVVSSVSSGVIEHDGVTYDIDASLGNHGVWLKSGGRRVLIARRVKIPLVLS